MAITSTTTLADLVPEVTAEAMFWFTQASLFYPGQGRARQFLQTEDLRNSPGLSYPFGKYAAIEMGDAVEGVAYTDTQALTASTTTVTASEKAIVVPVTDRVKRSVHMGGDRLIQDVGRAIGLAAATKFDKDVFSLFASLGSCLITTNNPITHAMFQKYITTLAENKAPKPYAAFISPWAWLEWVTESGSPLPDSSKSSRAGEAIWEDFFAGNIMGVDIYTHADIPTANAAADRDGAFMCPWAIGCVLKADLSIEPSREPLSRLTQYVATAEWGLGVIDATMGFRMFSDAD